MTLEAIEKNREEAVKDRIQELEDRAIGAKTVTFDGLNEMITDCLDKAGVSELVRQFKDKDAIGTSQRATDSSAGSAPAPTHRISNGGFLHFWGGRYRRLPEDFLFPDCGVLPMWQLWMCGNEAQSWPPLRHVDGGDLKTLDTRKRLSDLKYLMKKIQNEARRSGLKWGSQPQIALVNEIFERCRHIVEVGEGTDCGRQRRRSQLSWRTVVNILRRHNS